MHTFLYTVTYDATKETLKHNIVRLYVYLYTLLFLPNLFFLCRDEVFMFILFPWCCVKYFDYTHHMLRYAFTLSDNSVNETCYTFSFYNSVFAISYRVISKINGQISKYAQPLGLCNCKIQFEVYFVQSSYKIITYQFFIQTIFYLVQFLKLKSTKFLT